MQFQFSAGGVVYRRDPELKFLLIRAKNFEGDSLWQLPKGHIEKGETPQEAAVREIKEETNIDAEIETKYKEGEYFYKWQGELFKKKVYYFLLKYVGGEIKPQEGEILEAAWFAPEEAKQKIGYKNGPELIQKAWDVLKSNP